MTEFIINYGEFIAACVIAVASVVTTIVSFVIARVAWLARKEWKRQKEIDVVYNFYVSTTRLNPLFFETALNIIRCCTEVIKKQEMDEKDIPIDVDSSQFKQDAFLVQAFSSEFTKDIEVYNRALKQFSTARGETFFMNLLSMQVTKTANDEIFKPFSMQVTKTANDEIFKPLSPFVDADSNVHKELQTAYESITAKAQEMIKKSLKI